MLLSYSVDSLALHIAFWAALAVGLGVALLQKLIGHFLGSKGLNGLYAMQISISLLMLIIAYQKMAHQSGPRPYFGWKMEYDLANAFVFFTFVFNSSTYFLLRKKVIRGH